MTSECVIHYAIQAPLDLPYSPSGISVISDTTAIITMRRPKQLQYIEVAPRLAVGRTLQLNKDCTGVRVVGSDIYVACHGGSTHNTTECTLCCSREHQNCVVNSVHQISSAHVKEFYDLIRSFKDNLELVRSAMNENIDEIEERRRKLLIEAKSDYDKIIKNANNFFEETKREIREMSDKLLNNRLQNKSELENLILILDKELVTINTYTGKPINEEEMLCKVYH